MRKKVLSSSILMAWSILLTALTGIFGGVPLRALRVVVGSGTFWLLGLVGLLPFLIGKWWVLGGLYFALVLAVGIYSDLEAKGQSLFESGFVAILLTGFLFCSLFLWWANRQGSDWYAVLLSNVDTYLASIPGWNEKLKIESKDIVSQIPSLGMVSLLIGLFTALLFQRRMLAMLGMRKRLPHKLSKFAVPDFFIWVMVAGLGAAFLADKTIWLKVIGINLLNFAAAVFFLQGLAVVAAHFEAFRVGWIWQTLILLVLVTQLFVLVSALGLLDYWVDFRARLAKRVQELDQELFKK